MFTCPGDGGTGMGNEVWFTVGDIKQYLYCPRIPYFRYVMRVPFRTSYSMRAGKERHVREEHLERRRGFRKFGIVEGKRHFEVTLRSERLRLAGKLDMLIEVRSGTSMSRENGEVQAGKVREGDGALREWIPVEIKVSDRPAFGKNAVYQLVAYGLLVEEGYGAPVREGWLYNPDTKRVQVVTLTGSARQYLVRILSRLHRIAVEEVFPQPWSRKRCFNCEFRGYCNDIL